MTTRPSVAGFRRWLRVVVPIALAAELSVVTLAEEPVVAQPVADDDVWAEEFPYRSELAAPGDSAELTETVSLEEATAVEKVEATELTLDLAADSETTAPAAEMSPVQVRWLLPDPADTESTTAPTSTTLTTTPSSDESTSETLTSVRAASAVGSVAFMFPNAVRTSFSGPKYAVDFVNVERFSLHRNQQSGLLPRTPNGLIDGSHNIGATDEGETRYSGKPRIGMGNLQLVRRVQNSTASGHLMSR